MFEIVFYLNERKLAVNKHFVTGESCDEICKKIREQLKAMGIPAKGGSKKVAITDEEWRAALTFNPLFAHVDIGHEENLARFWCERNNRKFTRKFFENWLLRNVKDKPIEKPKTHGRDFDNSWG